MDIFSSASGDGPVFFFDACRIIAIAKFADN